MEMAREGQDKRERRAMGSAGLAGEGSFTAFCLVYLVGDPTWRGFGLVRPSRAEVALRYSQRDLEV